MIDIEQTSDKQLAKHLLSNEEWIRTKILTKISADYNLGSQIIEDFQDLFLVMRSAAHRLTKKQEKPARKHRVKKIRATGDPITSEDIQRVMAMLGMAEDDDVSSVRSEPSDSERESPEGPEESRSGYGQTLYTERDQRILE